MELTSEFVQTEIGIIPKGWSLHSLGDLVEYTKGFPFRSADYEDGGIRIIRVSDTTYDGIKEIGGIFLNGSRAAEFSKWTLRESDLIFSTVGSKPPMYDSMVGKVVIVSKQHAGCLLNQNAVLIRSKSGCPYTQRLVFDQCKTKRYLRHIEAIYRGNANQASITLVDLFSYKVAMPDKPEEQRAIAEALSDVDALINALDALITKKRHIKQGTMQQLLTGKKRLPGFAQSKSGDSFRQTEMGSYPSDWRVPVLGDLVDSSRSIRYGIVQPGKFDPRGRLMVRGQDYSKGWVSPSQLFRVSAPVELRYQNARLKQGDLIITIVGAGTGHVEVIPNWLEGANLTQTTARIAIDPGKASSKFCKHQLRTSVGTQQVANYVKGGAQPGLNCGDVEKFFVPLPPTTEEQDAIALALDDMDAEITALEQKRDKTKLIKQGMMQELLTGKTRLI